MPCTSAVEYVIDNKALNAFLAAKGLAENSSKYWVVRQRHLHKFRRVR